MKIGVIGMGFVGGVTAEVFSQAHQIFPYDKYKAPYTSQQCFHDLAAHSDVVFLCVPTPMKKSGEIDYSAICHSLDALLSSCHAVARQPEDILVTIRSTAVSGTTDNLATLYPFAFAFNPEFLREKHALEDMKNSDRIVLGVADTVSRDTLLAVYKPLFPDAKYFVVDRRTAEMIKYSANVMLASQIAIANELYRICQALQVDYTTVKDIILYDSRIARNIDVPGHDGQFGFGGKCFPKDLNALIYLAREHGVRPSLLEEVWRSNLAVRNVEDWHDIPGAVSENDKFIS